MSEALAEVGEINQWAEGILWRRMGAAASIGVFPEFVDAVRAKHSKIPIYLFDPGREQDASASSPPAGVEIFSDSRLLQSRLFVDAKQGIDCAALVTKTAENKYGRERVQEFVECLYKASAMAGAERCTEQRFGHLWVKSILSGLPHMIGKKIITRMRGALRGVSCCVVGAGPSLDKGAEYLRDFPGLIIACSPSLAPLRAVGVEPHAIAICDAHDIVLDDLRGKDLSKIVLIAGMHINEEIWDLGWKGVILAPHHAAGIGTRIAAIAGAPVVPSGGSVTTLALGCAILLNCGPLVLLGQDCAIDGDRYYAKHGPDRGLVRTGETLYDWEGLKIGTCPTEAWGNPEATVTTTDALIHFKEFFEIVARDFSDGKAEIELINASEGGAHIKGWTDRKLCDVHPDHPSRPWGEILLAHPSPPFDAEHARAYLSAELATAEASIGAAREALETASKAYDAEHALKSAIDATNLVGVQLRYAIAPLDEDPALTTKERSLGKYSGILNSALEIRGLANKTMEIINACNS